MARHYAARPYAARWFFRAGPCRASCRTGGPGTTLTPIFRAGPARRRKRPNGSRPGPTLKRRGRQGLGAAVQAAGAATARGEGAAVRRRPSDGGEGQQRNADGRWAEEWEGAAQAMSPAGRWMGGGCGTGHAAGVPWKGMVQRRGREGRGWRRGTIPQVHNCDS
jgi:hypothetical protein